MPRGKAEGLSRLARQMGVSPQRVWQLKQVALGLCKECPQPVIGGLTRCPHHREVERLRRRMYRKRDKVT
jgi:hypothetical protein